ncbi:DMT family transporter [Kushneria sinocarnis]|nr:DMT family transporter [Kushneria sinocarnis]
MAGVFTVSLWASLPVLRSLADLPPMLVAAVAMICASALAQLFGRLQPNRSGTDPKQGWHYWLMAVGGLTGALYGYFLALQSGDPAKVTLVTYTWPLGFVLITDRLAGKGIRLRTLLGSAVAFIGLMPLVLSSSTGSSTSWLGYAAGLAAGASWIAFSLYLRQSGGLSNRGYSTLFVHVSVIALVVHLLFEGPAPSVAITDWLVAGLIGIGPYGLAFMSWGYALRHGPSTLLGVMTYLVPVMAAILLVLLGWSRPSYQLLIAAAAVLGGALVTQTSRFRRMKLG